MASWVTLSFLTKKEENQDWEDDKAAFTQWMWLFLQNEQDALPRYGSGVVLAVASSYPYVAYE